MSSHADHESFRFDAVPYSLGALSPDETSAFEAHLAQCAACQHELHDLPEITHLLGKADSAAFETAPAVPDTLLPRLLAEVAANRRARNRRIWALGAVAACLAFLLALVTVPSVLHSRSQVLQMQTVAADVPVHATVKLHSNGHETSLDLNCRYDGPATYGDLGYVMVVTDRSGATFTSRHWTIRPGQDITLSTRAPWPKDQLASISLRTDTGREVLAINL